MDKYYDKKTSTFYGSVEACDAYGYDLGFGNEKTLEAMGHSVHNVSEDKVLRMLEDGSSLIIEVSRITRNATYQIIVNEQGGTLNVDRLYPWETVAEKNTSSKNISQQKSEKLVSHSTEPDIRKNPFPL